MSVTFACSICGDPATEICTYCTKDACGNHRCLKCKRCSDCCECVLALDEPALVEPAAAEPEPPPAGEIIEIPAEPEQATTDTPSEAASS